MAGARASHPNAAKLFIDFTLSKEGQEKLWDFQRIPSRNDVEPKPGGLFAATSVTSYIPRKCKNLDEDGQTLRADSQNALGSGSSQARRDGHGRNP